jgi:two-component system response regulator NreC
MTTGGRKRIVIAEDHTILREGLKALLSSSPEIQIAGEAADGREAVRLALELKPDMLLMDLSMPRMSGMEAIREIRKQVPGIRILVLTVHKSEEYVLAALQAGADGYILKDATRAELLMAIETVLSGKHYLTPEVSGKVIEGYLEGKKGVRTDSSWDSLTLREKEILKLIAEGYKNKQIAEFLCISPKTVEKHRDNLIKKLDLHNIAALTAYAMERGLVTK